MSCFYSFLQTNNCTRDEAILLRLRLASYRAEKTMSGIFIDAAAHSKRKTISYEKDNFK